MAPSFSRHLKCRNRPIILCRDQPLEDGRPCDGCQADRRYGKNDAFDMKRKGSIGWARHEGGHDMHSMPFARLNVSQRPIVRKYFNVARARAAVAL